MGQFFSRLSYSLGNEDCRTEHEALKIQSGDRVVCITASGDRPLHLLLADAGEVVAVDANPHQNRLLELKKIALRELSYEQYAGFLGASPMAERTEVWETIRGHFPDASRSFWDRRLKMIERGVIYEGSVEKWCGRLSKMVNWMRGDKVEKLFSFSCIDEQREFLAEWETKWLKRAFDFCLHPTLTRLFMRDPGLYDNLGQDIRPGEYIYSRFHTYLGRHLAKDSLLASLVLLGKATDTSLPPYLSRLGSALIRSRLDRISHDNRDIFSYLKQQPDASIDAFSLSDVASYVDKESFKALVKEMIRTAKPGARFCLRQFMSQQDIPENLSFSIKRDPHLEQKLEEEDRCFVYRFTVGTVIK